MGNSFYRIPPQAEVDAYNAAQKLINDLNKKVNDYLNDEAKRLKVKRKQVEKSLDEASKSKLSEMRRQLDQLKKGVTAKREWL